MTDGQASPVPLRIGDWVRYRKEDVFEACGALALAEVVFRRLGREVDAARMATVFDVMEAGLARPDGAGRVSDCPPPPPGRPARSRGRAS